MLDRERDLGSKVALQGDPGHVTYAPCGPHFSHLSDEAVGQIILLRLWGPLGTPSGMGRAPNPGPGGSTHSKICCILPEAPGSLCPILVVASGSGLTSGSASRRQYHHLIFQVRKTPLLPMGPFPAHPLSNTSILLLSLCCEAPMSWHCPTQACPSAEPQAQVLAGLPHNQLGAPIP